MMHAAAVWAWVVVVGALLSYHRPRARLELPSAVGCPPRSGVLSERLAGVGRPVRVALDRSPHKEAPLPTWVDPLVGLLVVVAMALLVVAPVISPLALLAAVGVAPLARRSVGLNSDRAVIDALPDATDLLALAVSSGLPVMAALGLVAPRLGQPLGDALGQAVSRVHHGASVADALGQLSQEMPATAPLLGLLVAAHDDGAPLVAPLGRLSDDLRADRRRRVESRARQVPVRMLFPLVACCLPAFVLLTIVPPIVAAVTGLESP